MYDYREMVRLKATLIEAMDEAHKIEKDIVVDNGTVRRGDKRRKGDGSFESLKKKGYQEEKGNTSSYYMRCHSSHKRPCSNNNNKSCRQTGHMSG